MSEANREIRIIIGQNLLKYWQVAERLGISDATFSRWLRTPLREDRKMRVEKAIGELLEEKTEVG